MINYLAGQITVNEHVYVIAINLLRPVYKPFNLYRLLITPKIIISIF